MFSGTLLSVGLQSTVIHENEAKASEVLHLPHGIIIMMPPMTIKLDDSCQNFITFSKFIEYCACQGQLTPKASFSVSHACRLPTFFPRLPKPTSATGMKKCSMSCPCRLKQRDQTCLRCPTHETIEDYTMVR